MRKDIRKIGKGQKGRERRRGMGRTRGGGGEWESVYTLYSLLCPPETYSLGYFGGESLDWYRQNQTKQENEQLNKPKQLNTINTTS